MVSNVNFTHSGSSLNVLKHKWMYSNNPVHRFRTKGIISRRWDTVFYFVRYEKKSMLNQRADGLFYKAA